jgi:flagellar biosynthesis/type III secretory pathway chaperone
MTTDVAATQADSSGRVSTLLTTMSRLIGVLEREIEMLRNMEPTAMQALQEDKIVLAAAYESQMQALAEDPAAVADIEEELRSELRQTTSRFQDVLAENERMLRAARHATDRLLGAIAKSVQRQKTQQRGYSAIGRPRAAAGAPASPMTLDQRL